jgi:hypothetical protein
MSKENTASARFVGGMEPMSGVIDNSQAFGLLKVQIDQRSRNLKAFKEPNNNPNPTLKDSGFGLFPIPRQQLVDPKSMPTFSPLQEWEGYVTEICDETFIAHLVDLTARKTRAEEQIEIELDEISDDDRELLRPGAIFRWSIGYQKHHGTKKKVSQIVFRRLPAWIRSELEAAKNEANELAASIHWE